MVSPITARILRAKGRQVNEGAGVGGDLAGLFGVTSRLHSKPPKKANEKPMKPTSLNDLIGQRLTSVTFIHDYVQLGFENYYGMSIFNTIRLMGHTGEKDQSEYGFKDSLCGLISHAVNNVEYEQEKKGCIRF
jgi:hypothetical protein